MKKKFLICLAALILFHTNIYASRFRFILNDRLKTVSSEVSDEDSDGIYCDIKGSWFENSADRLYGEGIFEGIKIGKYRYFQPNVQITRGEFLLYIETVSNVTESDGGRVPFEDFPIVPTWQKRIVQKMYNAKVISGAVEGGKLYGNLDEQISRLDAAQIIFKALKLPQNTKDLPYSDSYLIPSYAKDAVSSVSECEIMEGYADGSFRPYVKVTRSMLAEILCNAKDYALVK